MELRPRVTVLDKADLQQGLARRKGTHPFGPFPAPTPPRRPPPARPLGTSAPPLPQRGVVRSPSPRAVLQQRRALRTGAGPGVWAGVIQVMPRPGLGLGLDRGGNGGPAV
jgi:hypothetical protein